jgi:hypothetical protein
MNIEALLEKPAQGLTYDHFIEDLRDPEVQGPVVSPRRFSEALHIDLQTLAEQAGVHRNTIARAPSSAMVQHFLREALRVIKAATDVADGDVARALFWYRNQPLAPFGYKTPEQLVTAGKTEDLLRYTASLMAGAAG